MERQRDSMVPAMRHPNAGSWPRRRSWVSAPMSGTGAPGCSARFRAWLPTGWGSSRPHPSISPSRWTIPTRAWFLNQALLVRTRLPPYRLLARCLEVEEALGRQRRLPKGPRVIDVDILLYADRILSDRKLTIPHPRFHLRRFALAPVAEIAAGWKHPRLGLSVAGLLDRCPDPAQVVRVA